MSDGVDDDDDDDEGHALTPPLLPSFLHPLTQVWAASVLQAVKVSPLIERVSEHKDFKKLLRTRTNVLILYTKSG